MSDLDGSRDLDAMLAALPDSFRAALRLCYFEGLTHEEAAARLGCPVGTVRSRLARGRALLRRRLEASPPSRSPGSSPVRLRPTALLASSTCPAPSDGPDRGAVRGGPPAGRSGTGPRRHRSHGSHRIHVPNEVHRRGVTDRHDHRPGLTGGLGRTVRTVRNERVRRCRRTESTPPLARPPVAVAQADGGTRRKSDTRDGKTDQKPIGDLPADFPAFVVETQPRLGDVEVDADATKEIRIVFSKPMTDRSWSLTQGNVYAFPESAGPTHYLADRRTCVVPVKLEPGKTYAMGINGGRFNNFKDAGGTPALPSSLAFRTRKAK